MKALEGGLMGNGKALEGGLIGCVGKVTLGGIEGKIMYVDVLRRCTDYQHLHLHPHRHPHLHPHLPIMALSRFRE